MRGRPTLLEAEPDLTVAGDARDVERAVKLIQQLQPDVLLLDLAMSHQSGLVALQRINGSGSHVRTILLTSGINHSEIVSALQLGARGIVMKVASPELLLKGIRTVMEGHYWMRDERLDDLVDTLRRLMSETAPYCGRFALTHRELEIVIMVVGGAR